MEDKIEKAEVTKAEKLRDEIKAHKIAAFDYAMHLGRLTPEQLAHAGYRMSAAEAVAQSITRAEAEIEAKIRKYERGNP